MGNHCAWQADSQLPRLNVILPNLHCCWGGVGGGCRNPHPTPTQLPEGRHSGQAPARTYPRDKHASSAMSPFSNHTCTCVYFPNVQLPLKIVSLTTQAGSTVEGSHGP